MCRAVLCTDTPLSSVAAAVCVCWAALCTDTPPSSVAAAVCVCVGLHCARILHLVAPPPPPCVFSCIGHGHWRLRARRVQGRGHRGHVPGPARHLRAPLRRRRKGLAPPPPLEAPAATGPRDYLSATPPRANYPARRHGLGPRDHLSATPPRALGYSTESSRWSSRELSVE